MSLYYCSVDDKRIKKIIKSSANLRDRATILGKKLTEDCSNIEWVYNPLDYAWDIHKKYIELYGGLGAKTVILGMNPGHGMGNTGIPFGCPEQVNKYLKIKDIKIKKIKKMHPKRTIYGLKCDKPEISGRRIWGLVKDIYGEPRNAFTKIYVMNHFPLWMFDKKGRNITPDKLPLAASKTILELCDSTVLEIINALEAEKVIAVGNYAEKRINKIISKKNLSNLELKKIPHPSPANPLSNKEKGAIWREMATAVMP